MQSEHMKKLLFPIYSLFFFLWALDVEKRRLQSGPAGQRPARGDSVTGEARGGDGRRTCVWLHPGSGSLQPSWPRVPAAVAAALPVAAAMAVEAAEQRAEVAWRERRKAAARSIGAEKA